MVKVIACPKNDANIVVGFIQINILSRFGAPKTVISDERREAILQTRFLQN